MLRLNEFLTVTIIAQSFARRRNAACQRGFPDDLSRPEFLQQLIFSDQAVAMLDEVGQYVVDLALQLD
ncbi:MAG TPA: hypothetical protein VNN62_09315 [Methylomirabilota bacterium]|jgi:hypothetical protein|nr:hypothetical protein [Methylomirabilota bacterium]